MRNDKNIVVHLRTKKGGKISGKGGATVAFVPVGNDQYNIGIAPCYSTDNFCKKQGFEMAVGRAEVSTNNVIARDWNFRAFVEMAMIEVGMGLRTAGDIREAARAIEMEREAAKGVVLEVVEVVTVEEIKIYVA